MYVDKLLYQHLIHLHLNLNHINQLTPDKTSNSRTFPGPIQGPNMKRNKQTASFHLLPLFKRSAGTSERVRALVRIGHTSAGPNKPRDNLNYLIPSPWLRTDTHWHAHTPRREEKWDQRVHKAAVCDCNHRQTEFTTSQSHSQHSPPKRNNNTTTSSIQRGRATRHRELDCVQGKTFPNVTKLKIRVCFVNFGRAAEMWLFM